MTNPYAEKLGDRDPVSVIAATPEKLRAAVERLGERVEQPWAPGKWSPRETLCHLADTEIVFAFRLRQTLAEEHHVIQPFDQNQWAPVYGAYDAASALAAFAAVRHWNVSLIRAAGAAGMAKQVTHPERGEMTFRTIVETMAGHDLNHLEQFGVA